MVAEHATKVESARAGDRWVDVAGGLAFALLGAAIVTIGELTLHEDIQGDLLGPKAFPWLLGVWFVRRRALRCGTRLAHPRRPGRREPRIGR